MELYLTVTCDSFRFLDIKKKHPNSKKMVFTYQRFMCEEFLIYMIYLKRDKLSTVLFAISFPKIDKDLKTGF